MLECLREHVRRGGVYQWTRGDWPNRHTTRALETRGLIEVGGQGNWPHGIYSTITEEGRKVAREGIQA